MELSRESFPLSISARTLGSFPSSFPSKADQSIHGDFRPATNYLITPFNKADIWHGAITITQKRSLSLSDIITGLNARARSIASLPSTFINKNRHSFIIDPTWLQNLTRKVSRKHFRAVLIFKQLFDKQQVRLKRLVLAVLFSHFYLCTCYGLRLYFQCYIYMIFSVVSFMANLRT